MPGSFVKLQFEEGEVHFVVAPNLTDVAWEQWEIHGRPVQPGLSSGGTGTGAWSRSGNAGQDSLRLSKPSLRPGNSRTWSTA